jgi:hypothetical protein
MGVASSQAAAQNDQICAALAPIKSDQLAAHIGGSRAPEYSPVRGV